MCAKYRFNNDLPHGICLLSGTHPTLVTSSIAYREEGGRAVGVIAAI